MHVCVLCVGAGGMHACVLWVCTALSLLYIQGGANVQVARVHPNLACVHMCALLSVCVCAGGGALGVPVPCVHGV